MHNTFLHGDLLEEVYIKLPLGFSRGHKGLFFLVHKSLYDLKQAPRCWFAKLTGISNSAGFANCILIIPYLRSFQALSFFVFLYM